MYASPTPTPRSLAHREILRIPHGAGNTIVCQRGSVWVTEEADSRDQVLEAGEATTLSRPGTTVVYALRPSTVVLQRHVTPEAVPEPAPAGTRFSEWLVARWTSPRHAFAGWA